MLEKSKKWEPRSHWGRRTTVSTWISDSGAKDVSADDKTQSVTLKGSARGGLQEVIGGRHIRQEIEAPRCLMGYAVDRKPPRMVARTGMEREAVRQAPRRSMNRQQGSQLTATRKTEKGGLSPRAETPEGRQEGWQLEGRLIQSLLCRDLMEPFQLNLCRTL